MKIFVARLRKMNLIVLVVFTMTQSLILMKIMIYLWDYLETKGLFISKTEFVLKTQFIADARDDLPVLRKIIPITT